MAKDFKIAKCEGICRKCEQELTPETDIVAIVRDGEEELLREDFHVECFDQLVGTDDDPHKNRDVMAIWHTQVPKKEEKKKLLIDDNMLIAFFEQLEDQEDTRRLDFRYVLTLILMRKKILSYEGMEKHEDGTEVWKMRRRGTDNMFNVIDTKMSEDRIAEVSASLGDIMQGDFD